MTSPNVPRNRKYDIKPSILGSMRIDRSVIWDYSSPLAVGGMNEPDFPVRLKTLWH
jgi:hypothetical protein